MYLQYEGNMNLESHNISRRCGKPKLRIRTDAITRTNLIIIFESMLLSYESNAQTRIRTDS